MSDLILETSQLTKEFKGFTAVSKVDLAVQRGSIHALIGPNGAGKTTCFNLLTKFLEPTSGSIQFNGVDITREAPAQIARRGVIRSFQISAVFPHCTLLENVRIAPIPDKISTVGIEVPNKDKRTVSMRDVIVPKSFDAHRTKAKTLPGAKPTTLRRRSMICS